MKKIEEKNKQYESIEVLRFPLIVLVVFVHIFGKTINPVHLSFLGQDVYTLICEIISHNIGRIAVPCFFLFSGFFFFLKITSFTGTQYLRQIKKRWSTLGIPFIIWNALFVVAILLKNFLFSKIGLSFDDRLDYLKTASLFKIFWIDPINYPLWYLRDLICMVLITPIFYFFLKKTNIYGISLLLAIYLSTFELNIPGLSTTAFFFFGLGAYFAIYKIDFISICTQYGRYLILAAILLLCLTTYFNASEPYEYMIRIFTLIGVLSIVYIGVLLTRNKTIKNYLLKLAPAVFFIYAIHVIYIINWINGYFLKTSLTDGGYGSLFVYIITPILCITICLFLYQVMQYLAPRYLQFSIGGRIEKAVKNKNITNE